MSFGQINDVMELDDVMERKFESEAELRAAICRKYAQQYYEEIEAQKWPNLALIINDAIAEAAEQFVRGTK